jgi:hypothetical protein
LTEKPESSKGRTLKVYHYLLKQTVDEGAARCGTKNKNRILEGTVHELVPIYFDGYTVEDLILMSRQGAGFERLGVPFVFRISDLGT